MKILLELFQTKLLPIIKLVYQILMIKLNNFSIKIIKNQLHKHNQPI